MAQVVENKVNSIKGDTSTSGYQESDVEARLYHSVWVRERGTYHQQQARYWNDKVASILEQVAERLRE